MGILDDIKAAANANEAQVEDAIDKVGDFIDEKTGGKFADQVDQVQQAAKDFVGPSDSNA